MALIEVPFLGVIPFEWFITLLIIGVLFIATISIIIIKALFGNDESPVEENMALIVPVDRNGTIQVGQLVGGVEKTEDEIAIKNPDWKDDDGNEYTGLVPVEKKVPFPFFDVEKHLKKLYIVFDKGHLEAASASEIVNGYPSRYDIPLADRRKLGKFLVGRGVQQSITSALTSKTGIITVIGLIAFGSFMAVSIIALSGHLH